MGLLDPVRELYGRLSGRRADSPPYSPDLDQALAPLAAGAGSGR